MKKHIVEIWTDGSCKSNGNKGAIGAYAFLIKIDNKEVKKFARREENTTNNRMEILGIFYSLVYLFGYILRDKTAKEIEDEYNIIIYTDSAYCCNCWGQKWYLNWLKNGWKNAKKQPVKNKDLWEKLIKYFYLDNLKIKKVKGHANNIENNIVDKMAQDMAVIV